MCLPDKFPGEADAAGLGTTLESLPGLGSLETFFLDPSRLIHFIEWVMGSGASHPLGGHLSPSDFIFLICKMGTILSLRGVSPKTPLVRHIPGTEYLATTSVPGCPFFALPLHFPPSMNLT